MGIILEEKENTLTAYISGEIDHHTAGEIREGIDERFLRSKPKKLVLDYDGVTFMDSSGIGLIMGRYRLVKSLDGEIEVVNIPKNMVKVIRLSGIEKLGKISIKKE